MTGRSGPGEASGGHTAQEVLAAVLGVLVPARTPEPDTFLGTNNPLPRTRLFGGQVLGQSITAASLTIDDDDRPPHSLHGYFLRPGRTDEPVTFEVDRLHDGRSFSTRRTLALQDGRAILSMIASFQRPAGGMDHQSPMPDVPGPEDLPSHQELFGHLDIPGLHERLAGPVEMRHVEGPLYFGAEGPRVPHQSVWMRTRSRMPDDPLLHRAMLAFMSDYSLIEPTLRRHGVSWATPGLRAASLDHAMWFHRPFRVDEWLLYAQESTSASGARGLQHGRIFTRDGVLVASTAQEAMLRLPE